MSPISFYTAMRDPAGVLTTFYYDEAGALFAFDKGATRYYVGADQVGTPKVVSDAAGNIVNILEYDSFGMPTFVMNPNFDLQVGFAGGLPDAKTGLVRFGYRDYDPATGRWTAKDPIFFEGGMNIFEYTLNDPVNRIDRKGLASTCPIVKSDPAYDTSNPSGDPAYFAVKGHQEPSIEPWINNDLVNAARDNTIIQALKDYPMLQSIASKLSFVLSVLDPFPSKAY